MHHAVLEWEEGGLAKDGSRDGDGVEHVQVSGVGTVQIGSDIGGSHREERRGEITTLRHDFGMVVDLKESLEWKELVLIKKNLFMKESLGMSLGGGDALLEVF
ncbi:hypothetical protein VNO80_25285 [Phaseolus coccineus]|uniref:Uncharacterized protein n=1 Tax=Phaseolus coccineus TaxID=3886 RepID=A0AAN9LYW2_PHACN